MGEENIYFLLRFTYFIERNMYFLERFMYFRERIWFPMGSCFKMRKRTRSVSEGHFFGFGANSKRTVMLALAYASGSSFYFGTTSQTPYLPL